jgi:hypothetical protein
MAEARPAAADGGAVGGRTWQAYSVQAARISVQMGSWWRGEGAARAFGVLGVIG